jgi:hypothetical protein
LRPKALRCIEFSRLRLDCGLHCTACLPDSFGLLVADKTGMRFMRAVATFLHFARAPSVCPSRRARY